MQLMRFSQTHNGADGFGFYLIPHAVYRFVSSGMLCSSSRPGIPAGRSTRRNILVSSTLI